ncbi:Gfo/Idh/MocA family protein [Paenibacillus eucommiae]|uniref:Dehydrogenase n=1 Tax=Paenibacillus eucommiae TaxID=1355755 RepID=A0ABS4J268_9BACL|nr:putative dehydrogenase [Paenibacillus eucommiae]
MSKLRLGVIGTGGIFKHVHLPALLKHADIEIVALCDIIPAKAQIIADEHGIQQVYENYRDVLARDDIDAVDICTPNLYHSEIAIAALNAGKHVFCEKPDAVNQHEALKMKQAAESSGKVLMVMRNNRFRAVSQFLKRVSEQGHLGDIYAGRCGWIRRRGIPGKGGWFTTKELSGGGPLIDLGVHMIDLTVWLMGNPKPVSVSGSTYCKFAASTISDSEHSKFGETQSEGVFDVEDLANGYIRFDNGASLQLEFSWASNIGEESNFVELRGTKGGFKLVNDDIKLYTELEGVLCDIHPQIEASQDAHGANLYHFVDVIKHDAEPLFTPEQGLDMIKILDAIYESARTGKEVYLT